MAPPLEVMIPAISWELNNLVSNINPYSFILVLLNLSIKIWFANHLNIHIM